MGDDALLSPPSVIGGDNLRLGEEIVERIIRRIHPTEGADQRRGGVIAYVRDLIRGITGAETFPFGSVPLKTYLPDGDIDLTAIAPPRSEESLAREVFSVLQVEEQNRISLFDIKDVQYIHAEVKLVKCLVQNIVLDISFQRVGGLCTLCLLEKVDRSIGKNHLFKRSILLIKAWCYYESRILGAHHGLISTYALETLILYIFHLFHPSLDGPLEVLYRFLEYFSQFDWFNYGISLSGPVLLDSMFKSTEDDMIDSLLSRDFLKKCEDNFRSAFKWSDDASHPGGVFQRKHLNIVDPLKANNNLGRSVNQGNFHRIQSAFKLGARKLGRILGMPRERISAELNEFFVNTLERHCGIIRSETESSTSLSSVSSSEPDPLSPATPDFLGELFKDISKLRISELEELSSSSLPSSTSSSTPSSLASECFRLSDLAGDYNSCTRDLLYALGCIERHHPPSYAIYGGLYPSHMNAMASSYFPAGVGPAFFCVEDPPRSRGLGTYFPNARTWTNQRRRSTGRGCSQPHSTHDGGHTVVDEKLTSRQANRYMWRRQAQSEELLPPPPLSPPLPHSCVNRFEFGSIGAVDPLPLEREKTDRGLAEERSSAYSMTYHDRMLKSESNEKESRCRLGQGYHLKDEDFPPLSGLVKLPR